MAEAAPTVGDEKEMIPRTRADILLDEYREHKRCPNCNKPTSGVEEYKRVRSDAITRQCARCRASSVLSAKKHPRKSRVPPLTLHERCVLLDELVRALDIAVVSSAIAADSKFARLPEILGSAYRPPSQ